MDVGEQARRLEAVREQMSKHGLAVWLVPRGDEHQLPHAPARELRLPWLTGFTGSAGLAAVGRERAGLFVDGRYTIQADQQVGSAHWEHLHLVERPVGKWLASFLGAGERVGFDPRLHTPSNIASLEESLRSVGAVAWPVDGNLVDVVWTDRPAAPATPVTLHPVTFAGESAAEKCSKVADNLRQQGLGGVVISAPDALAWLLNIRGGDIANSPLALGYLILLADGTGRLFMNPAKVPPEVRAALPTTVEPPDAFEAALGALGGRRIRVDEATGSVWIVKRLTEAGAVADIGPDPCALPRACKNATELAGIRAAHERDGVALVRFMKWFADTAPGGLDEWSVARRVDAFRAEGENFRGPSFDTISAFGPNSALAHYGVTEESALPLHTDEMFLVDSGVQYLDGTTDVTRTFILGTPTAEMKRRYTQVLKGHIALAVARFPAGTTGTQLDVLARQFLWQDGVDFDHGTGHGVGCYLSVHEGPHGISKRPNSIGLRPGMIVSDEPGYYKAGAWGIRIENLLAVTTMSPPPSGAERPVYTFETLTLAPYERRLIETDLLTVAEREWVDAYHARVRAVLTPRLDGEVAAFLAAATAPLA